jgi:hypothetical protein
MKITLLYQAGIANVFDGDTRVMQHAYKPCEDFVRGLMYADVPVSIKHWDGAGDALLFKSEWQDGAGDLWADKKAFSEVEDDQWIEDNEQYYEAIRL